jgi:hypothetical protein
VKGRRFIQTEEELNAFADKLRTMNLPEHGVFIEIKFGIRTSKQNNAMHKYFTMMAKDLNDGGLDMRKVMKPSAEIPWTLESVKKHLWGSLMKALTGKEHTSELERDEVTKVYEQLTKHMGEKFGVFVPFPSKETQPGE